MDPLAAQINVGNVLMLRAPWNGALTDEMRLFPNGKWDDQEDALSRAYALLIILGRGGIGRAFDAMRQDPAVAASLGVNPTRYHILSFALSGAIAGLFGSLDALRNFSLTAEQFGFSILIGTLSAVVLGGRRTVFGPLVGVTILVLLPEIFRPLAQYRQAVYGLLLVLVMAFLPFGVFDSILMSLRNRRLARQGMLPQKGGS
jgi:branched-chain amino acid transport system permease protein